MSVILDTSQAEETLHQCSRLVPKNITGYWMPSEKNIVELERHLPHICDSLGKRFNITKDVLSKYGYQYIGVIINDHQFIYANVFAIASYQMNRNNFDISRYPFKACGGGDDFWGVLYDCDKATFSDLQINVGM